MSHTAVAPAVARRPAGRSPDARPRGHGPDAVSVLTVYFVLLLAIPSNLSFASLGSAAGRPATLWALGATIWWLWYNLQRSRPGHGSVQPVRLAIAALIVVAGISYATAMLRGLVTSEVSVADNALLRLVAWAGILLIANDGLDDVERFRTLMRRIAIGGGLIAMLGILQFITGQSLISWIDIPGMSSGLSFAGVDVRAGFVRAAGTATHPLEYGVVLSMAFPIAVALALEDHGRSRLIRWFPVPVIAVASLLSVSRSALIGLIAGLLLLFPALSTRMRILFATGGLLGAAMVFALVPGLAGTIRGMFTGLSGDSSTLSRVDSYDSAGEYFARFPIVGKGLGTFLPTYHILDNQYLQLAIELGAAGLVAVAALLGTAFWCAVQGRRLAPTPLDRTLCQSVLAAVVAGAILMAFFDGLSFPMSAGMLFLMIGICGGARRVMSTRQPGDISAAGLL
jgi:O-antigen ligase